MKNLNKPYIIGTSQKTKKTVKKNKKYYFLDYVFRKLKLEKVVTKLILIQSLAI